MDIPRDARRQGGGLAKGATGADAQAPTEAVSRPVRVGPLGSGADVEVKPGARVEDLVPEMTRIYPHIVEAWRREGGPRPVITSGNDSRAHMKGSRHYTNQAIDLRANNIDPRRAVAIRDRLRASLGPDYDVGYETFADPSRNHIHVEYDPD